MKKIYESIEIETWQEIAQRVQRLDISTCENYDSEFTKNLKKLKQLLSDLDICLDDLSREPKKEEEIGLASLLQAIYNSKEDIYYKKAHFYEQIYQLSELGVKNLVFCPTAFSERDHSARKLYNMCNNTIMIEKCYTDGKFKITPEKVSGKDLYGCYYKFSDLEEENYMLWVKLLENTRNRNSQIMSLEAILKNFNGLLPTKEEITKLEFPKVLILEQENTWELSSPTIREIYSHFDTSTLSCQKQLRRAKNHQFYYTKV